MVSAFCPESIEKTIFSAGCARSQRNYPVSGIAENTVEQGAKTFPREVVRAYNFGKRLSPYTQ
jgi:hypothetical protein